MAVFVPKTWSDELVEHPTRYKITHSDSSEEQVVIASDFGNETQAGDVFDAVTFNNLESRIAAGFASVQDVLSGTSEPTAQSGKNGDIYFQVVVEDDVATVIGMYVKISDVWLAVATGGDVDDYEEMQFPVVSGGGD